ncbi:hypothetical protein [Endozoicomonas acroporae]|nr:hypothetical protein [Endozoicomonas acroporae]
MNCRSGSQTLSRYQTHRGDLKAHQAEAIAKGDQEVIKNITSDSG